MVINDPDYPHLGTPPPSAHGAGALFKPSPGNFGPSAGLLRVASTHGRGPC